MDFATTLMWSCLFILCIVFQIRNTNEHEDLQVLVVISRPPVKVYDLSPNLFDIDLLDCFMFLLQPWVLWYFCALLLFYFKPFHIYQIPWFQVHIWKLVNASHCIQAKVPLLLGRRMSWTGTTSKGWAVISETLYTSGVKQLVSKSLTRMSTKVLQTFKFVDVW